MCELQEAQCGNSFWPRTNARNGGYFGQISGVQVFYSTDCCKGYYAVTMAEDSKDYTAFICHRGHFRFKVMSFGLVNSGATYSRLH